MEDVTSVVPVRRLSVVRGNVEPFLPDRTVVAQMAAVLTAKRAAAEIPDLPPFNLTDATCEIDGGQVTVTIQGFARTPLTSVALVAAAAALASLSFGLAAPRLSIESIQDVDGF